ncbi:MAG: hypothetical protein ILO68_00875 [Clostridia bacterium]|nr:hypothetical protein [Clostridia bacterium]
MSRIGEHKVLTVKTYVMDDQNEFWLAATGDGKANHIAHLLGIGDEHTDDLRDKMFEKVPGLVDDIMTNISNAAIEFSKKLETEDNVPNANGKGIMIKEVRMNAIRRQQLKKLSDRLGEIEDLQLFP